MAKIGHCLNLFDICGFLGVDKTLKKKFKFNFTQSCSESMNGEYRFKGRITEKSNSCVGGNLELRGIYILLHTRITPSEFVTKDHSDDPPPSFILNYVPN